MLKTWFAEFGAATFGTGTLRHVAMKPRAYQFAFGFPIATLHIWNHAFEAEAFGSDRGGSMQKQFAVRF